MAFLGEFLTYAFKFVVLVAIAFAGIMCGVKAKKKQLAQTKESEETEALEQTQSK